MSGMLAVVIALAGTAPLAPPPQAPVRYTVKAGDTLSSLGRQWMVRTDSWPQVQRLNGLADPYRIPIGTVLVIPRDLLKSEPVAAKVVAFRGDVTVGGRAVALGSVVREGDTITTGTDASITVESADGSRFSLPSRTRLGVARLRRVLLTGDLDRVFATVQGRGEWSVSPAPTPNSRFMVTTPVSVSAVRGTGFRVGYEDGAAVGVVEGNVGVSGADPARATPVPVGKGVAVTATGVGTPVDLLSAPELLRPGAVQSDGDLQFAMGSVPGARSYVYEVGTDAGLIDRVAEVRNAGEVARLRAPADGSYFVRVTATDANGIDGFSRTYGFERLSLRMTRPEQYGGEVRFRWLGGDGPRQYRFSLYADAEGRRPLIDRAGMAEPSIVVSNLRSASYWWRVSVTRFSGGRAVTATGPLQAFIFVRQ